MNIRNFRQSEYNVNEIFLNRWSPRAMSGEEIDEKTLFQLFEAARWAPSSNNNQPWRFIYARRNTSHWEAFFNLLEEGNKNWAHNAAALIVVISKTTFGNNKHARTHSYDAGAAWENFALQGSLLNLVVHGMQGFSYNRAKEVLLIPEGYQVEAMIALGRPGKLEDLPDYQQKREFPSGRKSIAETVMEGAFRQ
ncbi:MAG TPA: nitroreductase family protein [Smithellaceae bacterium]|jgi:nitroreductase|nr:MAG: malonic semialdehyde reductase [Deltaproteobacteria bacterium ADurb.BinA014]HNQ18613.1 nitroreductase family protein [Smithellaceae bacterium]HNT91215.1 nitroreductase family protein [Smithellaceae bacterium]HNV64570.1 nitroreductase family protein [Smithellaceae bacterium]HOF76878.1 nitroreductase family protein [Smithellaceae bacterium]